MSKVDVLCSLGTRAQTDPVTNLTFLEPADTDVRPWLGFGELSEAQLTTLLHEATHHWCMMSPVGSALSLIAWRSRLRFADAIEGEHPDPKLFSCMLIDSVKHVWTMELLRPLLEGLALFAEHDAISKVASTARSPVMNWAAVLATEPAEVQRLIDEGIPFQYALEEAICRRISRLRLSDEATTSKASLLVQPFAMNSGGYLPGYLAVKSLRRVLAMKSSRLLSETDLAMAYLRSFFFADYTLASILASEASDASNACDQIAEAINQRIQAIDNVTKKDIDAFEEALDDESQMGDSPNFPGLRQASSATVARENLAKLLAEFAAGTSNRTLREFACRSINRREIMHLSTANVTLQSAGDRFIEVEFRGVKIASIESRDPLQVPIDGTVEVVLSMRGLNISRAILVFAGDRIVDCAIVGLEEQREKIRQNVLATASERAFLDKAERDLRRMVAELESKNPKAFSTLTTARRFAPKASRQLWHDVSLRFARDYDSADSAGNGMQKGLKSLLGSVRAVKGLSLLGLAASINPDSKWLSDQFLSHGLDLQQTLDVADATYAKAGFPPAVLRTGGTIFTTI